MIFILTLIFFALGLIIGSFLNVVIFRFNTQRSFGGRSGCMTCQKQLCWYELIPLFSFLGLKGRCLACKAKISIQYPIVEFISGLVFAGIFLKFQDIFFINTLVFSISYAYYATMFSILLVIAVYDFKHKIIPDILSLIFGLIAFIGIFFFSNYLFYPHIPTVLEFLSGILLALPFAFLWLVSKGTWMGLGDAKLALGLGWLVGFSRILSGVVVAFWSGAILGIFLIAFSKKYGMKSEIPFAPFLVLGVLIAFFFELSLFAVGF
ncbi:prepilin peptidase [Candidatus Nomurabacteria bacterium CG_4_9_14_0_2_um_filter_32_10]|uniref:Prepilin peptidase n=3 Tax=Candidatus Nomuraibacteriota TaxID=1752729 RepID=A0A2H0CG98_9BACT|nr:MAG: prepilin peptidase [Candidatus Nomurabacteria bacterium CG22_combo_CG10-13_8_21_14_all_32_8]PIZ85958.1 MAG: prepilin peptidase [Candidatus Nomurabacteria bacterium CG_4_10_14_0_2_um_filter_33_9]PJC49704.1 MAG: prepilin peptidase [Candidatus Nomurabacteria bacterium CG_4_9_14_0_2_um_filter_32_10]